MEIIKLMGLTEEECKERIKDIEKKHVIVASEPIERMVVTTIGIKLTVEERV